MKSANLKDFIRGWIIGQFQPSLIKTNDVEVGIKYYKAGDFEPLHYHKIATEVTTIVSGKVEMNGVRYSADDIIVIEPNDRTDFKCLTDVVTVVVKYPGVNDDKYVDPA